MHIKSYLYKIYCQEWSVIILRFTPSYYEPVDVYARNKHLNHEDDEDVDEIGDTNKDVPP